MKKNAWKAYVFWILLPEAAGVLAALLTRQQQTDFSTAVSQPPLSPPAIVFPIVWTVLYALMGIGAARVFLTPETEARTKGLTLFLIQLVFNFFWSIIFFRFRSYGFALAWLAALWLLILFMTLEFAKTDRTAARLQLPYLLWVAFAGYLNYGVRMLNK